MWSDHLLVVSVPRSSHQATLLSVTLHTRANAAKLEKSIFLRVGGMRLLKQFQWDKLPDDGGLSYRCHGNLDYDAQDAFQSLIRDAERAMPAHLTLDFQNVGTLDSAGMGMLLLMNDRFDKLRGKIRLVGLNAEHWAVLHLVHFERYFVFERANGAARSDTG